MSLIDQLLPAVERYLAQRELMAASVGCDEPVVSALAQGEYNINYLVLASSGVTPRPVHLDERPGVFDHGLLIEEYLPSEPLDYLRDLEAAGRLFARLHDQPVPAEHHLSVEERPALYLPTFLRDRERFYGLLFDAWAEVGS